MKSKLLAFTLFSSLFATQYVSAEACLIPSHFSQEKILEIKHKTPSVKVVKTFKVNIKNVEMDAYQIASLNDDDEWDIAKISASYKKDPRFSTLSEHDLKKLDVYFMTTGMFLVPKGFKVYEDSVLSEIRFNLFLDDNNHYISSFYDAYAGHYSPVLRKLFPKDVNLQERYESDKKDANKSIDCAFDIKNLDEIKYRDKWTVSYIQGNNIDKINYFAAKQKNDGVVAVEAEFSTYHLDAKDKALIPAMMSVNETK